MLLKETTLGCLTLIVVILIGGIIGAICWPYSLNTWLIFLGKPATVLWWHGFLLGLIPYFGYVSIIVAVFTWIVMLFLV